MELTAGERFAIVIALMSFGVAFLALLWNIVNATRLDRARLKVKMWAAVVPERKGLVHHVIIVQATNVGKRPVQLSSLWIQYGPRPYWWHKLLPSKLRGHIYRREPGGIFVPSEPWYSRMPELGRLGVGDSVKLTYGQEWLQAKAAEVGATRVYAAGEGSTASAYTRRVSVPAVRQDVLDEGQQWAAQNL